MADRMMPSSLVVARQGRVATITLNQPEKRNPLTTQMVRELRQALDEISSDSGIRALVITGAGPSFSAGADVEREIEPLRRKSPSEVESYIKDVYGMFMQILDMDKPIIAAINGYAIATGLDLALVCDFRIAAEDAKLGEMRVNMGMTPSIGAYFLARVVGMGRAKAIAMIGETLTAAEAERIGLVHKVVPVESLMAEAEVLAGRLAGGPMAIGVTKRLINYAVQTDLEACMRYFYGLEYQVLQSEDHKEAVTAFLQKRKPVFKGR